MIYTIISPTCSFVCLVPVGAASELRLVDLSTLWLPASPLTTSFLFIFVSLTLGKYLASCRCHKTDVCEINECMSKKVVLRVKNPPAKAGDNKRLRFDSWVWKIPVEEENGSPLQYSCLENRMDRRVWSATVYRVAKSQTRLK